MLVDRLEVFSHATGRDAVNGETNSTWPDARALDRKIIATPPVEPVAGTNLRRMHLVEKFVLRPAKDTWYVVMARGTTRTMRPLHGNVPIAYSNAILIDADGSGRYDDFPLKPGQPLRVPNVPAPKPKVPTTDELGNAIRKLIEHRHD
ncbi:MAG: hypothetical protein GQE15_05105 [Archangiaceae bacterium]|nr:hypothetical protein [Archangiaceae bacterium]